MTPTTNNDNTPSLLSSNPSLTACWASAHLLSLCYCLARSVRFLFLLSGSSRPCCRHQRAGRINVQSGESRHTRSAASPLPHPFLPLPPFSPREYHGERLFLHDRKPLRTAEIPCTAHLSFSLLSAILCLSSLSRLRSVCSSVLTSNVNPLCFVTLGSVQCVLWDPCKLNSRAQRAVGGLGLLLLPLEFRFFRGLEVLQADGPPCTGYLETSRGLLQNAETLAHSHR